MKTPADMLASDLRRMAGVIPVGWRAIVLMALMVVVFPLLVSVFIIDALTYDMPAIRNPMNKVVGWFSRWMHHGPRPLRELQHQPST